MATDSNHFGPMLAMTAALVLGYVSSAAATEVSFSGGFISYAGTLGQTTYFAGVGSSAWELSPPATAPQGATDFGGNGAGDFVFPELSSQVSFSRFAAISDPFSIANSLAFTPAPAADISAGDVFNIGTFTFTNGGWFGDYPDSYFSFVVNTHSADPSLDGHSYSGRLQLNITSGCGGPSFCGTSDLQEIANFNADYFSLEGQPGLVQQFVGVYDNDFLPGNGAGNVGSVDFSVKIGSLIPIGFNNPRDGAVIQADIPLPPPNLQIAPNPNPIGFEIAIADAKVNGELFSNEGTVTISAGGTLSNSATFTNTALGTLSNGGTLVNEAGGMLSNEGTFRNDASLDNRGTINNASTFINSAGASVDNAGTVSNFSGTLANLGTFTNRGTVNNVLAKFENRAGGNFVNFGEFHNSGNVDNSGSVTNALAGGFYNDGGTFINRGSFGNDGVLQNSGTFTSEGSVSSFNTIINTGTGEINNANTFTVFSGGVENEADAQINNTYVFDVRAGAAVSGAGRYVQTGLFSQTVVNGTMTQGDIEITGGSLTGSGTVTATDVPLEVMAGASIDPGNSPGTLHVGGDLLCVGCDLNIEIGGTSSGLFDVLEIAGAATLTAINLHLSFIDGFLPVAGDGFSFLTAAGGFTDFATLRIFDVLSTVTVEGQGLAPDFAYGFIFTDGVLGLVAESDGHTVDPVPLPPALWMLLGACTVLASRYRRWSSRCDLQA